MDFQAIREKQESEILLLQNQISSFEQTMQRLNNDSEELNKKLAELSSQYKTEENSLESCAAVLEEQFTKKHSELTEKTEKDRLSFHQLKLEIAQKSSVLKY